MPPRLARRDLVAASLLAGAALSSRETSAQVPKPKRTRVGVIGCGSVSRVYFPHLLKSPFAEVVSCCDIRPERAQRRGDEFKIAERHPNLETMLRGAPFDLLVNLTDMQEHERLNRQAIEAGKHVWSEKPVANSLAAGEELVRLAKQKGVRLWGAPAVVTSPQFAFMAQALAEQRLGRVAAAHASYGWLGPNWSSFFYEPGGGSMPDLGVYNLTSLTGLLGPAKSVVAMTSIVTPTRDILEKGPVAVKAEDNAMLLLEHDGGVISHMQCGFNYFAAQPHDDTSAAHPTITITGTKGVMALIGYDWAPHHVDLATAESKVFTPHAAGAQGYVWEQGASLAAECLATGKEPLVTIEHALHVLEIMIAARQSQSAGQRIPLKSTFRWPLVTV